MARSKSERLSLSELRSRIAELGASVLALEAMSRAASEALQFSAAVQAFAKAEALRAELAAMRRAERVVVEADPYSRLCLLRDNAMADGSHVAAAKFEGLARQERDRMTAIEEAERARAAMASDWEGLWQQIRPMLHQLDRSQVLQLVTEVATRDDLQRDDLHAAISGIDDED